MNAFLSEIDGLVYNIWFSSIDAMCDFIYNEIKQRKENSDV